jgi:hypothetical protein
MAIATDYSEYLGAIRRQVCNKCVERPADGPPCAERGKFCGVEMHLPELIDSIHEIQSPLLGPYLVHNRTQICEHCSFNHTDACPCPMDYLLPLIIEAVESVDERHKLQGNFGAIPAEPIHEEYGFEEIYQAYEEGRGTWTGCDWPTRIGKAGLDLKGCTAAHAAALARETAGTSVSEDWQMAATWLSQVERFAREAEESACQAVNAARSGHWREALAHAQRAWNLELVCGRTLWRDFAPAWQKLRQVAEKAYVTHMHATPLPLVN